MSGWSSALGPAGLGVVFVGLTGVRLLRARRLRGSGVEADAVVVGQQNTPSAPAGSGSGMIQQPVIEFTTRDGRSVRVTSPAGTTETTLLPGESVKVYYDPTDPNRVSIPAQETGPYRILFAVGLLLLAISLFILLGHALLGDRAVYALSGIPAFVGAVFAGIGWYGIRRYWQIQHGDRTDGNVVGFVTSENRNGLMLYHPVVRYRTANGAIVEAPSRRGHMGRPLPPGMPVQVRYDRANPRRMMLAHEGAPGVFWLFGIIGIILLVIGLVIIVAIAF